MNSARARASAASAGSSAADASASTIRGGAGRRRAAAGNARRNSSNCAGREAAPADPGHGVVGAPARPSSRAQATAPLRQVTVDAPVHDAKRDRRGRSRSACPQVMSSTHACQPASRGSRTVPPAPGSSPRLDLGKTELQVARGATVMTGKRGFRAAAECCAVQCRHHGLAAGLETREHGGQVAAGAAGGRTRARRRRRRSCGPRPTSTIARTPGSASSASIATSSALRSGCASALTGGWSKVKTATSPSRATASGTVTRRARSRARFPAPRRCTSCTARAGRRSARAPVSRSSRAAHRSCRADGRARSRRRSG